MRWSRVRYRGGQFFRTLMARFYPVDTAYATTCLAAIAPAASPRPLDNGAREALAALPVSADLLRRAMDDPAPLVALFRMMPQEEQQHGIDTARALERAGFLEPALLGAALLHDVGKTLAPPALLMRVGVVLFEHAAPALARRWASWSEGAPVPRGLRRGLVVRRYHALWGALLVEAAGAPACMTKWIRYHHAPSEGDVRLAALQRADEGGE